MDSNWTYLGLFMSLSILNYLLRGLEPKFGGIVLQWSCLEVETESEQQNKYIY